MSFTVKFEITKRGYPVAHGILVYKPVHMRRETEQDILDSNGFAETYWHYDWNDEEIDVYCHTDGINAGEPALVSRIKLKPNLYLKLKV